MSPRNGTHHRVFKDIVFLTLDKFGTINSAVGCTAMFLKNLKISVKLKTNLKLLLSVCQGLSWVRILGKNVGGKSPDTLPLKGKSTELVFSVLKNLRNICVWDRNKLSEDLNMGSIIFFSQCPLKSIETLMMRKKLRTRRQGKQIACLLL